jgi:hypothetical protein
MQDVMRDLQILLEQSNLWKGELTRHPLLTLGPKKSGLRASDVLGEFYG